MNRRATPSFFGACSLLVIFALLTLVIFTLLTLQSAVETERQSVISAESESEYAAAELKAHRILSKIRAGALPENVTQNGNMYEYKIEINSSLTLLVKIELGSEGSYKILKWQSVRTAPWETDTGIDVWRPE